MSRKKIKNYLHGKLNIVSGHKTSLQKFEIMTNSPLCLAKGISIRNQQHKDKINNKRLQNLKYSSKLMVREEIRIAIKIHFFVIKVEFVHISLKINLIGASSILL